MNNRQASITAASNVPLMQSIKASSRRKMHWALSVNAVFSVVVFALAACSAPETPLPTSYPTQPPPTWTPVPPTATRTPIPATPTPACTETTGQVLAASLSTDLLPDKKLPYRVYLPPCYAADKGARYPVLYLLHGQTYTEDQWIRLGAVKNADRLIASRQVVPFLIVLPYDKSWRQPDEDNFGKALVEELIPAIDAAYRTRPERQFRAIGGLSRGGAWAIHLGLTDYPLFGAIGAHSPAVFWRDGIHLAGWLNDIPDDSLPRMFVDIGDNDKGIDGVITLEDLLTKRGVEHEYYLFKGFHDETYWSAHVEEYLRWYAGGW
jgi:enterochelin esterase-like enzyme